MTKKSRRFLIEGFGLVGAGILAVPVLPTLISSQDTVALFAAFGLFAAWIGWAAYFTYRIHSETQA